jgi:hypothetical protein
MQMEKEMSEVWCVGTGSYDENIALPEAVYSTVEKAKAHFSKSRRDGKEWVADGDDWIIRGETDLLVARYVVDDEN